MLNHIVRMEPSDECESPMAGGPSGSMLVRFESIAVLCERTEISLYGCDSLGRNAR